MMVSEKMRELGTKKSTIREIFEYGRKRAQEVGEENICDFSLGNPNVPAPDFIKQAVLAIMTEMEPQAVHGYTIAPGNPAVRETLAASINERFGTHFSGRNLFMTAGAAAAITVCFKALAEEGDEFIAFAPFFPEYRCFVESVGANLRVVPAKTEDFQIDFAALEERLSPKTKGVIVNSPNNPSGAVYSEKTIKELAALLRKKQQEYDHPIFLISDEPYREIAYGCEVPYITKYYENTLVCYSYSKSFSLAGERIGYIVVPDEVADFSSVYGAVAGRRRALRKAVLGYNAVREERHDALRGTRARGFLVCQAAGRVLPLPAVAGGGRLCLLRARQEVRPPARPRHGLRLPRTLPRVLLHQGADDRTLSAAL